MMNTTYETYMNALKQGLASFDSAAAEEILNDFESHFADARSQGLSDEEICAELGNVDDVLDFPSGICLWAACCKRAATGENPLQF